MGAIEQATGVSRFWTANGKHPEPNSDTLNMLEAYQYLPFTFSTSSWEGPDSEALRREVVAVVQVGPPWKSITSHIYTGIPPSPRSTWCRLLCADLYMLSATHRKPGFRSVGKHLL